MRSRRRRRAALAALALAAALTWTGQAAAERDKTTPTGWWYLSNATKAQVDARIAAGYRMTDVEVVSVSPLRFAASFVKNTGTYKKGWWWYYGKTANGLLSLATSNTRRLIDVEVYSTSSGTRYAGVMVSNKGAAAKQWWWWLGSSSFVGGKAASLGARIIDLDRRPSGGFSALMIKNSGADKKGWWWYLNVTPTFVANRLAAKKARLIDIERAGSGRFDVVMVKRKGEGWWWYYGTTAADLLERANQNGARLVDVERYPTAQGPRVAGVMLNNLTPLDSKLRGYLKPAAQDGAFGFYLKRVGGTVRSALQSGKVFEPASTIKAIHHLTAMRAVRDDDVELTDVIPWYAKPSNPARYPADMNYTDDRNVCAYESDGTPSTTLLYRDQLGEVILKQMMQWSDNRTTDAVFTLFGKDALNATAAAMNMTKSKVNHRIGCPNASFVNNALTLVDIGRLYEKVANGTALGTGSERDTFYSYMLTSNDGWKTVVDEEAAKLGKSQAVANAFLAAMRTAVKGGSYTNSASCPGGGKCLAQLIRLTGAGRVAVPVKSGGGTVLREFVYGSFFDGVLDCGGDSSCMNEDTALGNARSKVHREMLRPHIRAALQTW